MQFRQLGRSGLRVSAVGLGCNNLSRPGTASESPEGAAAVVHAALDAGVTLFDTAEMYGGGFGRSEELLGAALRGRRDEAVIATKFGHPEFRGPVDPGGRSGSRRYIREAVEASLRRLGTDRIDLYQLHAPDPMTPIDETLAALDDLVRAGKVLYLGHSNLAGWQLVDAEHVARSLGTARFVSAQNEYSPLVRDAERELLPAAAEFGVGFLPFFPLHNGVLTGKFTAEGGPADSRIMRQKRYLLAGVPWDRIERFGAFCAERGMDMTTATIGWLLSRPVLSSVIAGATTPEQVRANATAADAWTPAVADVAELDVLFA